jgi:uncharacterized protein with FMN-binding domain
VLRKTITSLVCASALAAPSGNLWAATHGTAAAPKKKKVTVVTKTVLGPIVGCGPNSKRDKWGHIQARVKVKKTTTTVGKRTTVKLRIIALDAPVYPTEIFKSKYITEQAMPLVYDQVLELQTIKIEMISGATDTVVTYLESLQQALLKARK